MSKIDKISELNSLEVYKILASNKLSNMDKAEFIRENEHLIQNAMAQNITKSEFTTLMRHRPLIKYKPIKNSFTKHGDDIILSKTLGISPKDIQKTINAVIESDFEINNQHDLDKIETMQTYVYRHGTKNQVIKFLEHELSDTKMTLTKLYRTLDMNSGGIAGYFSRPIHRMNNHTIKRLYKVIDGSLRKSQADGYINEEEFNSASKWALVQIYKIQNNQKIIHAYNLYKDLTT